MPNSFDEKDWIIGTYLEVLIIYAWSYYFDKNNPVSIDNNNVKEIFTKENGNKIKNNNKIQAAKLKIIDIGINTILIYRPASLFLSLK